MDINNSIFNCGQVYVALSRITSREGLYLIKYYPSPITANEEVIIKYNRLRQINKPEAKMISISKEHYRKVKDVLWTLSKVITSIQQNCQDKKSQQNVWIIHGFQNIDKVSCYVNVVLQCLLHLSAIRKQLFNCDKSNVLSMLMHRYENGMRNLKTYAIFKQYLGEYFSIDALEFLTDVCTKYDCIRYLSINIYYLV